MYVEVRNSSSFGRSSFTYQLKRSISMIHLPFSFIQLTFNILFITLILSTRSLSIPIPFNARYQSLPRGSYVYII